MMDKQADRKAAALLKKYDKLRFQLRQVEAELEIAAVEYGKRRGHLAFTRIETMRIMMEQEQGKRKAA